MIAADGNASYHSLVIRLTSRERRRLVYQVHYTLSKSIDTASDDIPSLYQSLFLGPVSSANPRAERGLSDFDRRHRIVGMFNWDLWPRSAGRGFLASIGRDWKLTGIVTYQSGPPVSVYSSGDFFGGNGDFNADGVLNDRPAYLGAGSARDAIVKGSSPAGGYSNPALFGAPGTNGRAALGRNWLPTPGYASVDLGLLKRVFLGERAGLEFRIEAFNLTNRVNFAPPVTDLVSSIFGQSRVADSARVLRIKLACSF